MSGVLLIAAIIAIAAIIFLYIDVFMLSPAVGGSLPGKSHKWKLPRGRQTEVVSNKRLGAIQRLREEGGSVEVNDQIVVWAREFLDDDVLYHDVSSNIERGVAYFYILDREHTERFQSLLARLYEDHDRSVVNDAVNVVFVRPELTLNNFVIVAYGTEHEVAYSAIIFGARPFAWIRQDHIRSKIVIDRVKALVAGVALSQADRHRFCPTGPFSYFDIDDQIMDFSELGRRLMVADELNPERATFDLRDVVAKVPMPAAAESKVAQIRDRIRLIERQSA